VRSALTELHSGNVIRRRRPAQPAAGARIRSAVLADAAMSFAFEALAGIIIPLQIWRSELGGGGVCSNSLVSQLSRNFPCRSIFDFCNSIGTFRTSRDVRPASGICSRTEVRTRPEAEVSPFLRAGYSRRKRRGSVLCQVEATFMISNVPRKIISTAT
jgi:hypothetical protein